MNSFIVISSCGVKKMSCRDFWYALVRNVLVHAGQEGSVPRPLGSLLTGAAQDSRLEVSVSKDRPTPSATRLTYCICLAVGVKRKVLVKYCKCDVGLCVWWEAILRSTTARHNLTTKLNHHVKNWGLRPNCNYKKLKILKCLNINFVYLGTKKFFCFLRHAEISLFCSSQNAANFVIPSTLVHII